MKWCLGNECASILKSRSWFEWPIRCAPFDEREGEGEGEGNGQWLNISLRNKI